jgi:glycosyltransferase involved in cell wall biosynthesis
MISVVIPAYNAGSCLGRTIDSVLAQTYGEIEIIVVNDGSLDNTEEVVKSYGKKVVYIHQDNAGSSVARNTGIRRARGEWIAFLDADDEFLPDKLERQLALLERNPELLWCAGNYYRAMGTKRALRFKKSLVERILRGREHFNNYFLETAKGPPLQTSSIVVHAKVLEELGGFEPGRNATQDLDVWWRIGHSYPALGYCADPVTICHLDLFDPVLTKRRLETKRALDARVLVQRHLKMAAEHGDHFAYKTYASQFMRERLLEMLFNGLFADAKETLKEFPDLLPLQWVALCYLTSSFPKLSVFAMHKAAYIAKILNLDKQVSRRWVHVKKRIK